MHELIHALKNLDRRLIYGLVFGSVILPLLIPFGLPIDISPAVPRPPTSMIGRPWASYPVIFNIVAEGLPGWLTACGRGTHFVPVGEVGSPISISWRSSAADAGGGAPGMICPLG